MIINCSTLTRWHPSLETLAIIVCHGNCIAVVVFTQLRLQRQSPRMRSCIDSNNWILHLLWVKLKFSKQETPLKRQLSSVSAMTMSHVSGAILLARGNPLSPYYCSFIFTPIVIIMIIIIANKNNNNNNNNNNNQQQYKRNVQANTWLKSCYYTVSLYYYIIKILSSHIFNYLFLWMNIIIIAINIKDSRMKIWICFIYNFNKLIFYIHMAEISSDFFHVFV